MAGANIKIGANSSDFQRQMKEVANQLKVTQSQFSLASEKAKLFGNSTDSLKAKQNEFANKLRSQNTVVAMNRDMIRNLNKDVVNYKNANEQVAKKIAETERKQQEAVKTFGKGSKEVKELDDKLKGLKEQYAKNEKAIENSNKKIDNQKIKLNESEKAILQTKKALEETNKALDNIGDKFQKFGEKAGNISNKMKPASMGIVGVGVASSKMAMNLEDGMAKISTIADTTQVPIDSLKKQIMDLSNKSGISINDLTEDVYNALSAGQKTGDVMNFVEKNNKLARAGFAESGQSLDLLTTVMNSYGMKAEDIDRISNDLITTQNLGKVTVGQLSADMGKSIPTAKAMGVNLENLSSAYALMTSKGIKSAETTTYVSSMMNELGKNGTTASKALKSATGKTFQELTASGKSLGDILSDMDKYANKNGKSLADMFGSAEAGKAGMLLASDAGKEFNDVLEKMNNNAGTTDEAFDKVNNTTGKNLKESLNGAKNSLIGFGDALAPFISSFSNSLSTLTESFNGLTEGQKSFIVTAGGTFVATNVALTGISKFSKGIGGTIKFVKELPKNTAKAVKGIKDFGSKCASGATNVATFSKKIGGIGWSGVTKGASLAKNGIVGLGKGLATGVKTVAQFTANLAKMALQLTISGAKFALNTAKTIAHNVATLAVTAATKLMSIAQAGLNLVMSLNPIVLIIGLLVALVATFVILYNKCDWFRNGVNEVWAKITSIFTDFDNFLTNVFTTDWTTKLGLLGVPLNYFFGIVGSIWNGIKGIFSGIIDFVAGVFTGDWSRAWNGVKQIFVSIFSTLGGILKAPINAAISAVNLCIRGLNKLNFDVPSWVPGVGGKHFGFNIPQIPALANGGIVTKATLALVGEGKEHEAVMPLSKLDKLVTNSVKKVLGKNNSDSNKKQVFILKNYMDSKEIGSYTYEIVNNKLALASKRRR